MIETLVVSFSLILARVGTFVALLPLFGGRGVPRMVKAGLALALTVLWFGSLQTVPAQLFFSRNAHTHWLGYGVALVREAILGASLGYAFGLILVPARIAGEYLAQEMGLTLANLADPTSDTSSTTLTQVFEMLSILLFLGLDGHHLFLGALHATFTCWPVGGAVPAVPVAQFVAGAASAEEWGLLLAAPVGLCLFVTTVVLALLARAAPQLNLFSVGFALRLGVGLGAVLLLLPELVAAMVSLFGNLSQRVLRWV